MASEKKLTKKDLDKMAYMSLFEQSCFSFERMQAVGFAWGMSDCFRKIFGDNNEEMAKALQNNLDFINTEPHMAAILQGLVVSMEESGQDRELIHSLKTGLFGPLAYLLRILPKPLIAPEDWNNLISPPKVKRIMKTN